MAIRLRFLGGARTVTGSSHLISTSSSSVLLDAGLFQGRRDEFYSVNTTLNYNPHKLNAVVLSHAHIDHCGNIPLIIKRGLHCKIYTTSATKDLAALMLVDSGKVQEEDIRYVNKINKKLGFPLRRPLYTQKEAKQAIRRFRNLSYNRRFALSKDIAVVLLEAGHILGSAIIVLEIKDKDRLIRLGYAVDLGRKNLPFLNDPVLPQGLDYLILETTYGSRLHAPISEAKEKLKEAVLTTYERKGKIIIPSFALERTQEVLYYLNQLLKEKAIPSLPIYLDSPLAIDINEVFSYHISYLPPQLQEAIRNGNGPLDFIQLRCIRRQDDSKALNVDKRPMIIIAGSGMCEAGRILHHLKNNIEDSRNTILVVGYMAQDTLGRKIVERRPVVRIFGIEHQLNAQVVVINAFSGHADRDELCAFVKGCLPLKGIFLVHGELNQSEGFRDFLRQELGVSAYIPNKDEELLLQ